METKKKLYKVYLMVPYLSWEDVVAEDVDDAIKQCFHDGENLDYNEHEKVLYFAELIDEEDIENDDEED